MTTADAAAGHHVEYIPLDEVQTAERNPKAHAEADIKHSISKFGFAELPLIDDRTGRLIAGHGRLDQLKKMAAAGQEPPSGVRLTDDGRWAMPVLRGWASRSDDEAAAYLIASNRLTEKGGWDDRELAEMLADLADAQLLDLTGYDPADLEEMERALTGAGLDDDAPNEKASANTGILAERFGVPPFTILDTRAGWWRNRKKAWLSLGIRSEEGRGDGGKVQADKKASGIVFNAMNRRDPDYYRKKEAVEQRLGRKLAHDEFVNEHYDGMGDSALASGTSIFDPVLCELAYRWYCPPGGNVIDPFAGGSVRGVVAAATGRRYYGGELRGEQVEANRAQWRQISATGYLPDDAPAPTWAQGDSTRLRENFAEQCPPSADLLFTCPPYADLEVYSDDPADLSNKPYPEFLVGYRACLAEGVALLADDSFAVLVVGEVRSKKGHGAYYGFVQDTIAAMIDLGLDYYSEHVLVNMVGSAAMAANKQFTATRKAVRVHQNVVIFVKGNAKRAADRNQLDSAIDLPDPEGLGGDEEVDTDAAS